MKRVIEGRYRLGVICREGREFKMNRVFRDLPPQWEMEILISQQLARADVDRLAGYDIVFYKSRAGRLLRLLEQVEARGKKVINPVAAVRLSKRRSECLERAAAQGVPVPRQYTGPLKEIPFDRYVVKSERESESYPTRLVRSEAEGDELRKQIAPDETVYAQAFLDSEWEYKLYCIGDEVFGFRQRPTLLDPDAQATRHRIVESGPARPRACRDARHRPRGGRRRLPHGRGHATPHRPEFYAGAA